MESTYCNGLIRLSITPEPYFTIKYMKDEKEELTMLWSEKPQLFADRKELTDCKFVSYDATDYGYVFVWQIGPVKQTRHVFYYSDAPAIRWYDTFETTEDCSAMYYSTLAKIKLKWEGDAEIVDFYTCSDQSNHRMIRKPAVDGKNVGAYFLGSDVFLYKEGPMPDSQPIPGEYDFIYNKAENTVEMVGLGFDNLRKGEVRRSNGVVIGLTRDYGIQRYNLARYKDFSVSSATEVLANSWPDLTFGVNEKDITAELHAAAKSGINVVFIDDGWFSTFMGEIDETKFPNKFNRLAEIAKGYGIEIGLWCNPLGMDSVDKRVAMWDGAESHDTMLEENPWNWLARNNDYHPVEVHATKERVYYSVDLMNPGYFEHIKNKLVNMYKEYGIRHFKFDLYNLKAYDTLLGDANLHYEAYRNLLEEVKKEIPELVISMDVTRKNRPNFNFALDYGRLFLENRGRKIKDHRYYHPYMALGNLWYTLQFAPARQCEVEMMPQAMDYSLEYILGTTIFATPLYWGVIDNTPAERQAEMKEFFAMIKPHREKFAAYLTSALGEMPVKGSWSGILSVSPDYKDGYIAVYRNGAESDNYSFRIPFGNSLKKVFGGGSAEIKGRNVEVVLPEEYSCALYQIVREN